MYKKHSKYTTTSPPTSCEKIGCKNEGAEEKVQKGKCGVSNDCKSLKTCKDKKCTPKSNNTTMIIIISVIVALILLGGFLYFLWPLQ
jgi:hypothetical protein